jgi:hypothetical protein
MPKKTGRSTREPRTTMLQELPAFEQAEAGEIVAATEHWSDLISAALSSEAGQLVIEGDLSRQLAAGALGSLDEEHIIKMADDGHPPADSALRAHIHSYINTRQFDALSPALQAFAQRSLGRAPLTSYPSSNVSQVVNDFTLEIGVCVLIDLIKERWPGVPKLYSSAHRHSAPWFVALVLTRRHGHKMTEQTARRIYNRRQTLARRLAEFMLLGRTLPFGGVPKGR